jgi:hypothetical protein
MSHAATGRGGDRSVKKGEMSMRTPLILAALAAAAAATPGLARDTPQQQLDKLLAGRTAGKPVSCITRFPGSDRSTTIPKIGIVYERGGVRYLNRFQNGCPMLDWDTILVTRTPSTQLCRGDIAQIVTNSPPAIPRGSCIYGDFETYSRPKK